MNTFTLGLVLDINHDNCTLHGHCGKIKHFVKKKSIFTDSDTEREGSSPRPVQQQASLAQPLLPSTICSGTHVKLFWKA